jgi:hypothetical protein
MTPGHHNWAPPVISRSQVVRSRPRPPRQHHWAAPGQSPPLLPEAPPCTAEPRQRVSGGLTTALVRILVWGLFCLVVVAPLLRVMFRRG